MPLSLFLFLFEFLLSKPLYSTKIDVQEERFHLLVLALLWPTAWHITLDVWKWFSSASLPWRRAYLIAQTFWLTVHISQREPSNSLKKGTMYSVDRKLMKA